MQNTYTYHTGYWVQKKNMMNNFKQECKLCDNIINDENFQVIDGDIFKVLLLKLTANETQNVICTMCCSKLLIALNFKSTCLYTDNTITAYVDFKNPKAVDLKQIYAKEKGSMLDDREVCRLCLQPVSGDHKSIQEVPVSSIDIYIPEINFDVTLNPVICIKCHDALHVHSTFIKNCLDADQTRNGDPVNGQEIFLNQSLKTEEIEIKVEETDEDILFDINKEEHDEGGTSLQSETDLTHTEESKSRYELDHRKQTSAQSWFANNQFEECRFKTTSESPSTDHKHNKCIYNTKHKGNFMQHQLFHKDPSEVPMFKCDACDYKSIRKGCLKRHQLRHKDPSEVRVFGCDQCRFTAKCKSDLRKHQLRHKDPSEVQVFQCVECDYRSIRKDHLKQHQLKHKDPSDVRVFRCDRCRFTTKRKSDLRKHQLIHKDPSEVQVFQCVECDYRSIRKDSLKQHQLKHKDPSDVPVFRCDRCRYTTKHKSYLKKHQLTHKDISEVKMFKCEKCTFETKHKKSLIKHCLTHKDPAEVQMYMCDKCKFRTKHKGSLKQHYLTHRDPSEVRVFQCDECDYKSIQKGNLKQHQLRHKYSSEVRSESVQV